MIARTWGFIKILLFIPFEIFYGIKYNVKTLFSVTNEELDVNRMRKFHSTEYIPTPYYIADKVFKLVKDQLADSIFIDFGSGAGRMLMFVSKFGPKQVIGVEFSKRLCNQANINLEKYFNSKPNISINWEIKNCDALEYEITPESNVFYFYDPFDSKVMRKIIKKIKSSHNEHNRDIIIIYISPVCREIFPEMGFNTMYLEVNKYNKGFAIYNLK